MNTSSIDIKNPSKQGGISALNTGVLADGVFRSSIFTLFIMGSG